MIRIHFLFIFGLKMIIVIMEKFSSNALVSIFFLAEGLMMQAWEIFLNDESVVLYWQLFVEYFQMCSIWSENVGELIPNVSVESEMKL